MRVGGGKWDRNAKLKERQKWSHEKPQLNNARRLQGFVSFHFEDKEFKEIIKNVRKKLKTSVAPVMLCKISKNNFEGKSNKAKSKFACILEVSESTRLRIGDRIIMMVTLLEKETTHCNIRMWCTNVFLCLKL